MSRRFRLHLRHAGIDIGLFHRFRYKEVLGPLFRHYFIDIALHSELFVQIRFDIATNHSESYQYRFTEERVTRGFSWHQRRRPLRLAINFVEDYTDDIIFLDPMVYAQASLTR